MDMSDPDLSLASQLSFMQWIAVYRRVFKDGDLDLQIGIYRNAEDGSCEICMLQEETWKERVIYEGMVFYIKKFLVRIPDNVDLER